MAFTIEDGKSLIGLARNSIESSFDEKEINIDDKLMARFGEKRGAFVTLHLNNELRGCIGFIEPRFRLYDAIIKASNGAAFKDPRFSPLDYEEYKNIEVEVSVLTAPEEIMKRRPEELIKEIKVNRDGLIVDNGCLSGCLLPQVAVEWGWNEKQLLEHTCMKAGLDKDAWQRDSCKVYRFSAQIFSEKGGKVIDTPLSPM